MVLISIQVSDVFSMVHLCLLLATEDSKFLCVFEKQMFVFPAMVTMSISATWMYSDLADFFFHPEECIILPFHHSPYSLWLVSLAL